MYKIQALLLALLSVSQAQGIELPCRLRWEKYRVGNPYPETAVPSHPGQYFIARAFNNAKGDYDLGVIEAATGEALLSEKTIANAEILTNPYLCELQWIAAGYGSPVPQYAWPVDETNGHFELASTFSSASKTGHVARIFLDDLWVPGTASASSRFVLNDRLKKALNVRHLLHLDQYQVLRSFSRGLQVTVDNFTTIVEQPPPDGVDFLGMDLIRNDADVNITHTVTHRKTVMERFGWGFEIETSLNLAEYIAIGVSCLLPPVQIYVGLGFTQELHYLNGFKFQKQQERELTLTKIVHVPPRTSVQVCSLASIWTSSRSVFSAEATYQGKGLTGEEVLELLRQQNPDVEGEVGRDYVKAAIQGVISKSTVVTTEMLVLPADAMKDCDAYAEDGMVSTMQRERAWAEFESI